MKSIRRYIRKVLRAFRETYTCHICKTEKPKFEMQNIFTISYRDRSNPRNCCSSCFSMTDETPFLYCQACGESSPYDEMTLLPNQEHKPGHKRIWVHRGDCPRDDNAPIPIKLGAADFLNISSETKQLESQRRIQ